MSTRTAVIMWAAQAVLVLCFATSLTLRVADPSSPLIVLSTALLFSGLVTYTLGDRARMRAYPTATQKMLAVGSLVLAFAWVIVMTPLSSSLHSTDPFLLTTIFGASVAVLMAAAVFGYRARYFFWQTSDKPPPRDANSVLKNQQE